MFQTCFFAEVRCSCAVAFVSGSATAVAEQGHRQDDSSAPVVCVGVAVRGALRRRVAVVRQVALRLHDAQRDRPAVHGQQRPPAAALQVVRQSALQAQAGRSSRRGRRRTADPHGRRHGLQHHLGDDHQHQHRLRHDAGKPTAYMELC